MSLAIRNGLVTLQVLWLSFTFAAPGLGECPPGVQSCPLPGVGARPRPQSQAPQPARPAVAAAPSPAPGVRPSAYPRPWQATVRVRVSIRGDSSGQHLGTGTVVVSDASRSVVLTCAHFFRDGPPSAISVELFDGVFRTSGRYPNQQLTATGESYPAVALGYDLGRDVGLLEFRPGRELHATPVAPASLAPRVGDRLVSVGCDGGQDAIAWTTTVVSTDTVMQGGARVIQCTFPPAQGRSGGGLHLPDGRVVGVCNWRDGLSRTGGYADGESIRWILDAHGLRSQAESADLATWKQPKADAPPAPDPNPPAPAVNVQVGASPQRPSLAAAPDASQGPAAVGVAVLSSLGTVAAIAAAMALRARRPGLALPAIASALSAGHPPPDRPPQPPSLPEMIAMAHAGLGHLKAVVSEIDRIRAQQDQQEKELAAVRAALSPAAPAPK